MYVLVYNRRDGQPDILVPADRKDNGALRFPSGACLEGRDGCVLLGSEAGARNVAVSPNGKLIYALSGRDLMVAHVDSSGKLAAAEVVFRLDAAGFTALGLTADGRRLYAGVSEAVSEAGGLLGFNVDPVTGGATRVAGPAGCARNELSVATDLAGCELARLSGPPSDIAISPDGAFLYSGSYDLPSAVAMFELDATTGTLNQPAGPRGCVSGPTLGAPGCTRTQLPEFPQELAAAGDTLYVTGVTFRGDDEYHSIAILRQVGGSLTQAASPSGCVWTLRPGACAHARGLGHPGTLQAWGERVAFAGDSFALFRRHADGTLSQSPGRASCADLFGIDCMPLGWETHSLVSVPGVPRLLYGSGGDIVRMLAVAPARPTRSRARLVFRRGDGAALWSVRPNGEALAPIPIRPCPGQSPGYIEDLTASRTGRIAYQRLGCGTGRIREAIFAGRPGSERLVLASDAKKSVDQPSLSRNGQQLAYRATRDYPRSRVEILDLRSARRRVVARMAQHPAIGPRGAIVVDRLDHNEVGTIARKAAQGLDVVTPTGRRQPLTREHRCKSPRRLLRGCEVDDDVPTWRPDGTVLFLRSRSYYDSSGCSEDCRASVITKWLMKVRPGAPARRIARVSPYVQDLAVAPDGRLAFERAQSVWVGHPGENGRARAVADGLNPAWIMRPR